MPKAAPLAILALSILISTSAAGQEASSAPDASAPEQARVTTRRQPTLVAEPVASRPAGPNDSFSITRDAQRELQRLGCYDGEINGDWSQSSRAAAERFLDRVNAKLPTDKADDVLLALLQGQKGFVCSQCPPGQMLDPRDRCTPTALLRKRIFLRRSSQALLLTYRGRRRVRATNARAPNRRVPRRTGSDLSSSRQGTGAGSGESDRALGLN